MIVSPVDDVRYDSWKRVKEDRERWITGWRREKKNRTAIVVEGTLGGWKQDKGNLL